MARQGMKTLALAALAVLLISAAAAAQEKVKLEIKSAPGDLAQYTLQVGGTVDMDLMELPFPHASTTIKNLQAMAEIDLYFQTLGVEDGVMTYDVKGLLDKVVLGNLLELDGLGMKSTLLSPKITLAMDGTGKIQSLDLAEMDLAGGGLPEIKGLSNMGFSPRDLNSFMPMIVGLLPSVFPAEEIAVGSDWSKEVNFDDMGMGAFLPRIPFHFKLLDYKEGIADIAFTSDGKFDGAVLKSFLALIPELPMGKDIVKIQDVGLVVKWAGTGTMKFNVAAGRIDDMAMSTNYDIAISWNADFNHPDDTKEEWAADGTVKLKMDLGLQYAGAPTLEAITDLFPPAEEAAPEDGKSKL